MYVQVAIILGVEPTAVHKKEMLMAASSQTNDKNSVHIFVPEGSKKTLLAIFTIKKARQMDVVDNIGKAFQIVNDYQDCRISFPKKAPS